MELRKEIQKQTILSKMFRKYENKWGKMYLTFEKNRLAKIEI